MPETSGGVGAARREPGSMVGAMLTERGMRGIIVLAVGGVVAAIVSQKASAQSGESRPAADRRSSVTVDELVEEGHLRRSEDPPRAVEPPPVERSFWAVNLGLGAALGGDPVLTVYYEDGSSEELLAAGDGGNLLLGTTLTPVRVGRHSAGLGVDFGVKYGGTRHRQGDARLSMTRYPFIVSAHYGYDIGSDVSLIAAGGLQAELAVHVDGSGGLSEADMDLHDAVGGMVEGGVILESHSIGFDLSVRYTGIGYRAPGFAGSVSGSSFGVFIALHLNLLLTTVN